MGLIDQICITASLTLLWSSCMFHFLQDLYGLMCCKQWSDGNSFFGSRWGSWGSCLPACLPAWDMQYMGDDESHDKEVVEDARASESRSFTLLLELQVCHSSTTTSLHSKTRWFSWPHSLWPDGNQYTVSKTLLAISMYIIRAAAPVFVWTCKVLLDLLVQPRRSDLDMNQHVNNVKYINWMMEVQNDSDFFFFYFFFAYCLHTCM